MISAAALIMIGVFGSFVLNGDPTVKQFGVGLAVAVALAASMVLILTPALMALMGKATWMLPRRLARALPEIDIEGEKVLGEQRRRAESSPNGPVTPALEWPPRRRSPRGPCPPRTDPARDRRGGRCGVPLLPGRAQHTAEVEDLQELLLRPRLEPQVLATGRQADVASSQRSL